jgi:transmembrane sensor
MFMSEHIEKLIIKALQGDILPEEHHELERWLAEDETNRKLYNEFVSVWKQSINGSQPNMTDSDVEWARLEKAIDAPKPRAEKTHYLTWTFRAAAAIAFVLLCTYLYNTRFPDDGYVKFTSANDTLAIQLPDGSRVTLNHDTELSYYADFRNNRSIQLKGEAFFNVEKDVDHPFIIETERATVRVVGTSFNVDAQSHETRLAVMTGVVELSTPNAKNPFRFTAGEGGIASASGIVNSDELNALAWKNKTLVFKDTPLRSVVAAMEKYFEKDLQIADNLSDCKLTAEFKNPTFDEVVGVLRDALALDVKVDGERYMFNGEGCDASE